MIKVLIILFFSNINVGSIFLIDIYFFIDIYIFIDIYFWGETFLTSNTLDNEIHIDGYNMERKYRSYKNGGGTVVFIKENIPYKRLTYFKCQDLETFFYRNM